MKLDVSFCISALSVFNPWTWDLGNEICYALFEMAQDNEFGDRVSESILDICQDDYHNAFRLKEYISRYSKADLKAVDAERDSDNDFTITYSIPVTINI